MTDRILPDRKMPISLTLRPSLIKKIEDTMPRFQSRNERIEIWIEEALERESLELDKKDGQGS